jgi:hypothetical protein
MEKWKKEGKDRKVVGMNDIKKQTPKETQREKEKKGQRKVSEEKE